jgi:hypothetical protein
MHTHESKFDSAKAREGPDGNIKDFLIDKISDVFYENIPITYLKNLPTKRLVIYVGTFSYMILFAAFGYFFYTSMEQSLNTKFISLDDSSGICNTIEKPLTGLFKMDS